MVLLDDSANVDAQVDACLSPFGDSANVDARQVHGLCRNTTTSKIILDTPDRTPR